MREIDRDWKELEFQLYVDDQSLLILQFLVNPPNVINRERDRADLLADEMMEKDKKESIRDRLRKEKEKEKQREREIKEIKEVYKNDTVSLSHDDSSLSLSPSNTSSSIYPRIYITSSLRKILTTYMNSFIKTNPIALKYQLNRLTDIWNYMNEAPFSLTKKDDQPFYPVDPSLSTQPYPSNPHQSKDSNEYRPIFLYFAFKPPWVKTNPNTAYKSSLNKKKN
jgi:hypothetical protein